MALKLVRGIRNRHPSRKSREEYLLACLREELDDPKFTDWERSFISSLARQVREGRRLTEKQKETLERIWRK
ncbi:MAG TPA: hypothetical protein VNN77_08090 [candidate division Zixibacteria bacterium]|nr:hypothetical protein [candidate division Zixibacteria bacterium]